MKSINHSFYNSRTWQRTQQAYMKRVNGICERCLANGFIEPAKIVHHKIHLNEDNVKIPEIAYGFDNLEALCQDCHNKEHFGENTRRYEVVDGKLVIK